MPKIVGTFPPIGIDYSPKKLQAVEKSLLKIMLEIPEGFDIMAHKPSEEFLIPAEVIFESPEGIVIGEPIYPEPLEEKFDWMETKLRIYKGRVDVDVPIEIATGKSKNVKISGVLSFQGCTQNQCLPPKKQEFTLSFEIAGVIP